MKTQRLQLLIPFCLICMITATHATDLMQIYHQAQQGDPTFAQARATWLSEKLNLPIARSNYLPRLTITGNDSRNYDYYDPPSLNTIRNYSWKYGYTVTLDQPLFAVRTWQSIREADALVKAATASYLAAQQALMVRVATAYFKTVKAYDELQYTEANQRAIYQQLITAEEKFKTGLIAINDVYDARSRYDLITTQVLTAKNNLDIELEGLRKITGHYYKTLQGLGKPLPLINPTPNSIDAWTRISEQQNYNIQSQNFNVIAAMRRIKQAEAGDIPSFDLSGDFTETKNLANSLNKTTTDSATLELNVTYKPIQGGLVTSVSKQARYNYQAAVGKLQKVHRDVINQTRTSFLSIHSGLKRIKGDKESIYSAHQTLAATEAGFQVGARTMVDVLNDLTTVYQAEQQYAKDQYTLLDDVIGLKEAAGTLSEKDLYKINLLLRKTLKLPEEG